MVLLVRERLILVLTFTELETNAGTSGLPELLVPHPLQDQLGLVPQGLSLPLGQEFIAA